MQLQKCQVRSPYSHIQVSHEKQIRLSLLYQNDRVNQVSGAVLVGEHDEQCSPSLLVMGGPSDPRQQFSNACRQICRAVACPCWAESSSCLPLLIPAFHRRSNQSVSRMKRNKKSTNLTRTPIPNWHSKAATTLTNQSAHGMTAQML